MGYAIKIVVEEEKCIDTLIVGAIENVCFARSRIIDLVQLFLLNE